MSRRSFYFSSSSSSTRSQELEQLSKIEQEITLTLQEIDKNLSNANSIINESVIPRLGKFRSSSSKIWSNVEFWKSFFENSANVEITTEESEKLADQDKEDAEIENTVTATNNSQYNEINQRYKENVETEANETSTTATDTVSLWKEGARKRLASSTPNRKPIPDNDTSSLLPAVQLRSDDIEREQGQQHPNGPDELTTSNIFDVSTVQLPQTKWKITESPQKKNTSPVRKKQKSIATQYDSSPIEEPPILKSAIYLSPVRRKSKSPSKHPDTDQRFPKSPKYGAGGKLLRNSKGTELALNFARSELASTTADFSFQTAPLPGAAGGAEDGAEYGLSSSVLNQDSTTMDEAPQLQSQLPEKTPELASSPVKNADNPFIE
ncbi:hypothetical protein OGAPHI_001773 [Ogataea philodendri]|uniref:DASH complex subunit ASK1 n=1 Tax=Ogataea philodendri TaxID=1378263 RepID=A0A9P8PAQ4_9ASCO|nr:uncharacterized protein OGAPHI_001773 [Ogataea philodendri]KAH3668019.1 hypothetical protein OGAPHI_001773 [Ogataea philodendri]